MHVLIRTALFLGWLTLLFAKKGPTKRVVSLSPSVTEIVYGLSASDQLVGVTQFCDFPEPANEKTKVGGFLNPNVEVILRLKPDTVILLEEHESVERRLHVLGLKTHRVEHRTFEGILNSIESMGNLLNEEKLAQNWVLKIRMRMEALRGSWRQNPKVKVLFSTGRVWGQGHLKGLYVMGSNTFYNDCLLWLGAENALKNQTLRLPQISSEALLRLKPDVVFDLIPNIKGGLRSKNKALADWESVPLLEAVTHDRVFVISEPHSVIPGPRFIDFMEQLVQQVRFDP